MQSLKQVALKNTADISSLNYASKLSDGMSINIKKLELEKKAPIKELISINYAALDELTKLDNIGKAKAESIIKYRETYGQFNSLEDITKVSGISWDIYNKIKDDITL